MNRSNIFFTICMSLLLAGCATPYRPYVGESASKVRLKLANGSIFSSVAGHVRTADDGDCGKPMRVPQLFPYFGPADENASRSSTDSRPTSLTTAVHKPSDTTRSNEAELHLAPGRHLFSFFAGLGMSNCAVPALIDLEPKRHYEIEFRFDTSAQQCLVKATRLQEASGRSAWQPYGFVKGDACNK